MKKIINIIIIAFYTLGSLLLPLGDFSVLNDIPQMYQHCKATEDKDMSPFDFITDHLINIDCLFDKHDNGDNQKPHAPFQFKHQQIVNYFLSNESIIIINKSIIQSKLKPVYLENIYCSNFLSCIFHPPIA